MSPIGLHPKQAALLDYWRSHTKQYGIPPTIRAAQRDLGISAPSVVVYHLERLVSRGYLDHHEYESHAYRVPLGAHDPAQNERKDHE